PGRLYRQYFLSLLIFQPVAG
ncbi:hypothetical protein AZZ87_002550, partial [Escherichia coli]